MSMIKVTVSNNVKRSSVIVSSDTTLRQALETNEIDYTRGLVNLDGAPLMAGDLDKTFADFGIAEKCFLSAIVKTDNAATVSAIGEAAVVTSELTLDEIKLIAKYRPKALELKGGEDGKEVVFVIGISSNPKGSINSVGAEFGGETHDGNKRATITFDLPSRAADEDVKDIIIDRIGTAILDINKLEAQLGNVIEEINKERADIISNISIG